jgi:hypothetical protein
MDAVSKFYRANGVEKKKTTVRKPVNTKKFFIVPVSGKIKTALRRSLHMRKP